MMNECVTNYSLSEVREILQTVYYNFSFSLHITAECHQMIVSLKSLTVLSEHLSKSLH